MTHPIPAAAREAARNAAKEEWEKHCDEGFDPGDFPNETCERCADAALAAAIEHGMTWQQWMPIASAPSMAEVLVFEPGQTPQVFTAELIDGEWGRSVSGRYKPLDDFFGDGALAPTHWMPLPAAPEDAGVKG